MAHINQPDQTIHLKNGRTLGYAEYGDPDGTPIICFHGNPGSRLDLFMAPLDLVADLKTHIIVPDRPGIGLSSFQPGRKLMDWPEDVLRLADAFGFHRFAVFGVSSGGPYAAACAFAIPERLTAAAIVSGVSPLNVPGITARMGQSRTYFNLARISPSLVNIMVKLMRMGLGRGRDPFISQVMNGLPEPDRQVLTRSEVAQSFYNTLQQAVGPETRGIAWDAALLARDWGFRLREIAMPVNLFHGEADLNAPVEMGRYMAEEIPNCTATFYPNEGHLSTFYHHLREIITSVITS